MGYQVLIQFAQREEKQYEASLKSSLVTPKQMTHVKSWVI
jgi:hypothetical protein